MPELKFEIDDKMYTISCEEGEEDELKKALKLKTLILYWKRLKNYYKSRLS